MYIHQLKENMQRQGKKCLCLLSRENSYPGVFCDLFTNHDIGNYLRHGILVQPIRGCPQHSGEIGTQLSLAIHRCPLPIFSCGRRRRLYTSYVGKGEGALIFKITALLFLTLLVKHVELKFRSDCPKDFWP